MTFKLSPRQEEASNILGSPAMHQLFYGGARSGKTFVIVRAICIRAIKVQSRHTMLRFRFNHIKESIVYDTFPKLMALCFPQVPYEVNKSDWFAKFPNGSEIWFGGLDDKERSDKILGKEYASMFFNECSQIPYGSVETALTRLAQKTGLPLRAYYDENPPDKNHWTYKKFIKKLDPISGSQLPDGANYAFMQMKPEDNAENLAPEFIGTLKALSGRRRKRFFDGEFADANPNALWSPEVFDKWRVLDDRVPDFQRIVVAVDPSGSGDEDNKDNDEIGIIVAALGTDGNAYVLEDLTLKAGPATWGKVATTAYERHKADVVVGEKNFGGAMVEHVIKTARANTPFKAVTASRGKVVRAEPISSLYENGKVRHVGFFTELEDECSGFTTTGYTGERSPNRADAMVWAISELFPGLVRAEAKPVDVKSFIPQAMQQPHGYLAG
jgi:predicted phage terminase large subunit-like protein